MYIFWNCKIVAFIALILKAFHLTLSFLKASKVKLSFKAKWKDNFQVLQSSHKLKFYYHYAREEHVSIVFNDPLAFNENNFDLCHPSMRNRQSLKKSFKCKPCKNIYRHDM